MKKIINPRYVDDNKCGFQDHSLPVYFMYKKFTFKPESFKIKLKKWLKKVCLKLLS